MSSTLALTPSSETLVEVAIVYAALTLESGTPLIAYGPVTKRFPDLRFFKTTTLLPLFFPVNKMTIFPAWMDLRPVEGLGALLFLLKRFF